MILRHRVTPHFAMPRLPQTFLFTIGGCRSATGAPSSSVEVYDSNSNHWSGDKLELPVGLDDCTAQAVVEKIYTSGGKSVDPRTQRSVDSSQTLKLDVDKNTVECSVPLKEERNCPTSAVVDSTIYIIGGGLLRALMSCNKLDTLLLPLHWDTTRPMEEGRAKIIFRRGSKIIFFLGGGVQNIYIYYFFC